jgi:hypothetical protein
MKAMLIICLLFSIGIVAQEQNSKIRASPKAETKQVIGLTNVTIDYSRPAVKERKIWGGLVPYGKIWRAGANEATRFTFSTDVMVEGKKLSKGSYSFFVIPGEKEWVLIFNKVSDQWGAFTYNEAEDALRIRVKPKKGGADNEWLTYNITKTGEATALISLEWEKMMVAFTVEGAGS